MNELALLIPSMDEPSGFLVAEVTLTRVKPNPTFRQGGWMLKADKTGRVLFVIQPASLSKPEAFKAMWKAVDERGMALVDRFEERGKA